MNATEPLPRGQQLLLQRLMASHCMSGKEATEVFESLVANGKEFMGGDQDEDNQDDNSSFMGSGISTLQEAFVSINRQLKPGFGLEIVTMVDTTGKRAKYFHAVVNTAADKVAKSANIFAKSWNPHERAFVRLVIGALVEQKAEDEGEEDDDEDGESTSNNKTNSVVGIEKKVLVNQRAHISGGFSLTLGQAQRVMEVLLDEKWLRVSPAATENNRRDSGKAMIELAPRSYMELYHYIMDLGMEADKLPQFLYHRD